MAQAKGQAPTDHQAEAKAHPENSVSHLLDALDHAEKEDAAKKLWKKQHQERFQTLEEEMKFDHKKAKNGEGHQMLA